MQKIYSTLYSLHSLGESLSSDCSPDQFKCANSRCVNARQVCDDVDDCGDASDENGCREFNSLCSYELVSYLGFALNISHFHKRGN